LPVDAWRCPAACNIGHVWRWPLSCRRPDLCSRLPLPVGLTPPSRWVGYLDIVLYLVVSLARRATTMILPLPSTTLLHACLCVYSDGGSFWYLVGYGVERRLPARAVLCAVGWRKEGKEPRLGGYLLSQDRANSITTLRGGLRYNLRRGGSRLWRDMAWRPKATALTAGSTGAARKKKSLRCMCGRREQLPPGQYSPVLLILTFTI
jgi:hypothetical protein